MKDIVNREIVRDFEAWELLEAWGKCKYGDRYGCVGGNGYGWIYGYGKGYGNRYGYWDGNGKSRIK
jgi:hypothetical protein